MGNSQLFEGVRFSVKVDSQTMAHLLREAAGASREHVGRRWLDNWRTLANLSPYLYERLVYAAQQRKLSLVAIVNEALSKYCAELPPVPPGVKVITPISVLDEPEAVEEGESDETAKSKLKRPKK